MKRKRLYPGGTDYVSYMLRFYMVSGEKGLYPDGTDYIFFMFRFYMVSGEKGWYPDGTDCRSGESRSSFCVKESELTLQSNCSAFSLIIFIF